MSTKNTDGDNELLGDYAITEERKAQLDLAGKRYAVDHSLTLHRDSVSVGDVKAMIRQLEAAGMPEYATLNVTTSTTSVGYTRLNARWHTVSADPDRKTGDDHE